MSEPTSDEQEMYCEWADYRKEYGVPESCMNHAHGAFVAGWEAARGNSCEGGALR